MALVANVLVVKFIFKVALGGASKNYDAIELSLQLITSRSEFNIDRIIVSS